MFTASFGTLFALLILHVCLFIGQAVALCASLNVFSGSLGTLFAFLSMLFVYWTTCRSLFMLNLFTGSLGTLFAFVSLFACLLAILSTLPVHFSVFSGSLSTLFAIFSVFACFFWPSCLSLCLTLRVCWDHWTHLLPF